MKKTILASLIWASIARADEPVIQIPHPQSPYSYWLVGVKAYECPKTVRPPDARCKVVGGLLEPEQVDQ